MVEYSENVGIAFGVVFAAGLSTAVGAAVVFFPSLIQYANRKTLAGGLGLSAGVMTYVSFVEIFGKSVDSFVEADFLENQAYLAASLCFFAGVILMICLNFMIHGVASHNLITQGSTVDDDDDDDDESEDDESSSEESEFQDEDLEAERMGKQTKGGKLKDTSIRSGASRKSNKPSKGKNKSHDQQHDHSYSSLTQQAPAPCCCSDDPVGKLEDIQRMAKDVQERDDDWASESELMSKTDPIDTTDDTAEDLETGTHHSKKSLKTAKTMNSSSNEDSSSTKKKRKKKKEPSKKDKQRLTMMSLNTAVAIALHNFPEGLATFVATLQDPAVGAVLAIAIAIHNIPEGLCVAMPVYYATGDRWRAFSWGLLSGVSEPLAALMGWIVLASVINDMIYAVLFGIVAGMMVVISIKELIPTAHRYDPSDSCVTNMFITGMAIMAASLVLFAQL